MPPPPIDPRSTRSSNRREDFRVRSPLVEESQKDSPGDPFKNPVNVRVKLPAGYADSVLVDLSRTGLCVLFSPPPSRIPNQILQLTFQLPTFHEPRVVPARPINHKLVQGGLRLGLAFAIFDRVRAQALERSLQEFLTERQRLNLRDRAG